MKFKDKLLQDHPEFRNKITVEYGCPKDYGYEKMDYTEVCLSGCDCDVCWNREMPDKEPKALPKTLAEHDEEMRNQGYNKGLNDAWELAKKCVDLEGRGEDNELMFKIFNTVFLKQLFNDNTPQEALAKLKEYEDSKIEVGDVVTEGNRTFIVTHISCDCVFGLLPDGDLYSVPKISDCKKTGKHIDIKAILEQIGE